MVEVLVVGDFPREIRVSREQYLGLLSRLETATHRSCPHEAELGFELIDTVRLWVQSGSPRRGEEQLELPLEWPEHAKG